MKNKKKNIPKKNDHPNKIKGPVHEMPLGKAPYLGRGGIMFEMSEILNRVFSSPDPATTIAKDEEEIIRTQRNSTFASRSHK